MKIATLDLNKFFASLPKWDMAREIGYEPKTTFWQDFSIADAFENSKAEPGAIVDTFDRAFSEWKDDIIYLTELALVLNHKGFWWYKQDETISRLYFTLWEQVDDYAHDNLSESDAEYYFQATD